MPGVDLQDLSESTLWIVAGEGKIDKIKVNIKNFKYIL